MVNSLYIASPAVFSMQLSLGRVIFKDIVLIKCLEYYIYLTVLQNDRIFFSTKQTSAEMLRQPDRLVCCWQRVGVGVMILVVIG